VFKLQKPTTAEIERSIAAARHLAVDGPGYLRVPYGLKPSYLDTSFAHDHSRSLIGHGDVAFRTAVEAFERWAMFDLGWVNVANPACVMESGQIIAVAARTLGLWTLNLSRIVEVIRTETLCGFLYSTTPMHVEQGEERFLLELDPSGGEVFYEVEAVSRPRHWLAQAGLPISRAFQHRFVRDSHRRMWQAVSYARPE
jgi:uncharacterized protein (UPF0548 family)